MLWHWECITTFISENADTHATRIKEKKKQLKSSAYNRFASRRTCGETGLRRKGRGEKVCVEAVASKSPVSFICQVALARRQRSDLCGL